MAQILGKNIRSHFAAPHGRDMCILAASYSASRRGSNLSVPVSASKPLNRVGKFDVPQLRGLLPGRDSTSSRKQSDQKGSELQWATQMPEKYRLGKVIGTGAFGTIRLARSKETGETVAIKVLSKSRPGQSRQRTSGKLQREARCMSVVQECEGVVELKGLFEDLNSAYFVMEHCTGGDLEQLVQNYGQLTEHQAAVVLFEVLQMVAACHRVGVCHGDIKPANFLMAKRHSQSIHKMAPGDRAPDPGWLKAIDFGCAQQVVGDKPLSRRTGTPVYMAPEVFVRRYACPADMWSVGMLMYHLLSARFPFWDDMQQCKASSLEEVMDAVKHRAIVTNFAPFTTMSPEGMSLLSSLLVRDPSKRLNAEAALDHSYFKIHLGWQAEEPRLLQKTLPALVTSWQEKRPSLQQQQARAVPSDQSRVPDDVVFVPYPAVAGDATIVVPLPVVANNVVEYSSSVNPARSSSSSSSRIGSCSRTAAQGPPAISKPNRGSPAPSATQPGKRGQQVPPERRRSIDLQLAYGA